jgi:hypothetical protein
MTDHQAALKDFNLMCWSLLDELKLEKNCENCYCYRFNFQCSRCNNLNNWSPACIYRINKSDAPYFICGLQTQPLNSTPIPANCDECNEFKPVSLKYGSKPKKKYWTKMYLKETQGKTTDSRSYSPWTPPRTPLNAAGRIYITNPYLTENENLELEREYTNEPISEQDSILIDRLEENNQQLQIELTKKSKDDLFHLLFES